MRPDFDEIRTLTKRFVLIPQKVAKFVFGVFRYECSGRGIGITEIGITEIVRSFVRLFVCSFQDF